MKIFLIFHDIKKLEFFVEALFSGITALTAFKRNAKGVNGGSCLHKSVYGIFAGKLAALVAFTPLYGNNNGVFPKKFGAGGCGCRRPRRGRWVVMNNFSLS